VATGYERGEKKLGVPTANLLASAFGGSLEGVETGVYSGWAELESGGEGGGAPERTDGSAPRSGQCWVQPHLRRG